MRYFGANSRLYVGVVLSLTILVAFAGIMFAVGPYGRDFGRIFAEGDFVADIVGGPYPADFGRLFANGDQEVDTLGGPYRADFGRLFADGDPVADIVGGPYRADFRY